MRIDDVDSLKKDFTEKTGADSDLLDNIDPEQLVSMFSNLQKSLTRAKRIARHGEYNCKAPYTQTSLSKRRKRNKIKNKAARLARRLNRT